MVSEKYRKDLGRIDATMAHHERLRARLEEAAAQLLEDVLRRRRWTVQDRDRVADFLEKVVRNEAPKVKGGTAE